MLTPVSCLLSGRRAPGSSYSSAYSPPAAISSAWLPTSATRPPSTTTIRSAIRTVLNRCETSTVIAPLPATRRAAAGVPLEQGVLGLGVQGGGRLVEHQQQRGRPHHRAAQRELLPLAAGEFCAVVEAGPKLRLQPGRQRPDHVARLGPHQRTLHGRRVLVIGEAAHPDALAGQQLQPREVLEARPRSARATPRG